MTRPRLILVPHITELEWVIKSELEQWAEVAAFDMPGVGAEPAAVPLDRQALVDRAVAELDAGDGTHTSLSATAPLFRSVFASPMRAVMPSKRWRSVTRGSRIAWMATARP